MAAFLVLLVAIAGQIVDLGELPGGSSGTAVYDLSADGQTAVGVGTSETGQEIFRWAAGTGIAGMGFRGYPFAASADGSVIVGQSGGTAFRWTQIGGLQNIGDLPGGVIDSRAYGVSADGRVVVGEANSPFGEEPFRWSVGEGMIGLGTGHGHAVAISGDGHFITGNTGWRWSFAAGFQATGAGISLGVFDNGNGVAGTGSLWTQGAGLSHPFNFQAFDASADGSVIVGRSGSPSNAFVWDRINGERTLEVSLIYEFGIDTTGWRFETAEAVSADGRTIVGNGYSKAWIIHLPRPLDCIPGDTNDDGSLTVDDIPDFVAAILAGSGPARCGYDLHPDGRLDGRDVRAFALSL